MAAPATLSLRPYAGLAPRRAERDRFAKPPPLHHLPLHQRTNRHLLLSNRSRSFPSLSLFRAVSVGSEDLLFSSPPADQAQEKARKYYFLVANAKFMLDDEEHFQELLFERLRNYGERNKEQDFWLVIEPKFLDKFPNITRRLKRPAVALVSTDANWITNLGRDGRGTGHVFEGLYQLDNIPTSFACLNGSTPLDLHCQLGHPSLQNLKTMRFMKLRLDRVLAENFEADSFSEVMASNPVDLQFEKPEKWVAPYPKYEYGWWETFLPNETSKTAAYVQQF